MQILVAIRNVYGNQLIYPVCERAKMFAKLAGRKTLSEADCDVIRALGFEICVETPKLGGES